MKIRISYEDRQHPTYLEVPDEQCELWAERDYQRRLAEAPDKSTITRRSAQQIMDEECNCPTFNNEHAETRRHVAIEALDPLGDTLRAAPCLIEAMTDYSFEELHAAIEQLTPEQQELLRQVFWEERKQVEIAREEGVDERAISHRMVRIYARLKKLMKN